LDDTFNLEPEPSTEPNMEADMVSSDWFVEKIRSNENYAQLLYAALCNNAFRKQEVFEILKGSAWSCSWRYAGGIVADILDEGDYLDWYCSGGEGHIDEELAEDLNKLGWIVIDNYYDEKI